MTRTPPAQRVPGDNNNATYGPVPRDDQILQIDVLEIAPTPLPVNRTFFVLLRGVVEGRDDAALANATLDISLSVVYPDGSTDALSLYTTPLRTQAWPAPADAYISIRNAAGAHVECLTAGRNDILGDFAIPGMFVRKGTWTFGLVAKLADDSCLFAVSLTQWLEGSL